MIVSRNQLLILSAVACWAAFHGCVIPSYEISDGTGGNGGNPDSGMVDAAMQDRIGPTDGAGAHLSVDGDSSGLLATGGGTYVDSSSQSTGGEDGGAGDEVSVSAYDDASTEAPDGEMAADSDASVTSDDAGDAGDATCGARDCSSLDDNNCNGEADQTEAGCSCSSPTAAVGETAACVVSGAKGKCAKGTKLCTLGLDRETAHWGSCKGPQAGALDCCSSDDNDCDGAPDNQQSPCNTCTRDRTKTCDTHVSTKGTVLDGIGACHAGTSTCVQAANCSTSWGACAGSQGPTTPEACGPQSPDVNCNGVVGDGQGSGCVDTTGTMFTTQFPGTAQLLNCRAYGPSASHCDYMALGSCDLSSGVKGGLVSLTEKISEVGWVSSSNATGYKRMNIPAKSCDLYGGTITIGQSVDYFVLPVPLPSP